MPPEVLRNPIDEIYGYTCKKKTQTYSFKEKAHRVTKVGEVGFKKKGSACMMLTKYL